jgi:hypothetical protein
LTVELVDEQLDTVPSSLGPLLYASTPVPGITQEPAVALGKMTAPQAGVAMDTTPDAEEAVTQPGTATSGVMAANATTTMKTLVNFLESILPLWSSNS